MSEKMWGSEPFWGLGYEWDPDWFLHRPAEGAPVAPDRALREGAPREREALRRRAALPAPEPRAARRARLPGADRSRGIRRARREPRRLRDGLRDDRALRLRVDRDVLRDAHRRGEHDHAPPHARADRQVHPPARKRQDRDALLFGSRDRVALLVPDLVRRRALERRLQRAQEGVVDDLCGLCRLLRRPDDEPRLLRLRRPVRLRHRRGRCRVAAVAVGRARPSGQPVGPARGAERRGAAGADRRPGR